MRPGSIQFRDLHHYPIGNAILEKRDNALIVSSLIDAMDGIGIDTGSASDVSIYFLLLEIKSDMVLGVTFNSIDNKQRLKSIGQWAITQSGQSNVSSLLLNLTLEGQSIMITGKKNHRELFRNEINVQQGDKMNWLLIGSFHLSEHKAWLSHIDCSLKVIRNMQGKIIQLITTKVIGSMGLISLAIKDIGKVADQERQYSIDELQISSTANYPEGLPYEWENNITQVMITGQNIWSLALKNSTAY